MKAEYKPDKLSWRQRALVTALAVLGATVALADYLSHAAQHARVAAPVHEAARPGEPVAPVPPVPDLDPRKLSLGEALYHDPRLSGDGTVSCATCHDLAKGGTDGLRYSLGIGGAPGKLNSPTTFNAALNFAQYWDGRVATLEAQVPGPVHNPAEMGSSWPEIVAKLGADPDYVRRFAEAYAGPVSAEAIVDAIATFERSLLTPDAPFDRYLRGEADALGADAQEGYRQFKSLGCVGCHQGVNLGGNLYQTLGVMDDYFAGREIRPADLGRFNVTGEPWNRFQFKVPTLRNVALTAPYLHDGSAETLEDVIAVMAKSQLGRPLTPEQTRVLVAFLRSLTGTFRGQPL